jgi:hypothetical protein
MEWLKKEKNANFEALTIMRSFIPHDVNNLTINNIIENASNNNGLYTLELATEIKNNKLLHWIVTHQDDISSSNFLYGDKKTFFDNFEYLDVVELRAIAVCLPLKFDFDNDGKKMEWRNRF